MHTTVYMRSNDIWKGLITDIHFLAFLQEILAAWLEVEVGTYTHIIGSAHVYEKNLPVIEELLEMRKPISRFSNPNLFLTKHDETFKQISHILENEKKLRNLDNTIIKFETLDSYLRWGYDMLFQYIQEKIHQ